MRPGGEQITWMRDRGQWAVEVKRQIGPFLFKYVIVLSDEPTLMECVRAENEASAALNIHLQSKLTEERHQ